MRTKKPKLLEAERIVDAFLNYKYTDAELEEMYFTLRARLDKDPSRFKKLKKDKKMFRVGDLVEISDKVREIKWLGVQGKVVGINRTRLRIQVTKTSSDFPTLKLGTVTTALPEMLTLVSASTRAVSTRGRSKPVSSISKSKLDILFE